MNLRGNEQEVAPLGPCGLVEKLETISMEALVVVIRGWYCQMSFSYLPPQ